MNVKKWLKIAVYSSPLNIYHGPDNIIKQSFISYSSMKFNRNYSAILATLQITSYALGV